MKEAYVINRFFHELKLFSPLKKLEQLVLVFKDQIKIQLSVIHYYRVSNKLSVGYHPKTVYHQKKMSMPWPAVEHTNNKAVIVMTSFKNLAYLFCEYFQYLAFVAPTVTVLYQNNEEWITFAKFFD